MGRDTLNKFQYFLVHKDGFEKGPFESDPAAWAWRNPSNWSCRWEER